MKSVISAPLTILSALLAGSTALSSNALSACTNCGQQSSAPIASPAPQRDIFKGKRPRIVAKKELFQTTTVSPDSSDDWRIIARGPIFGEDNCNKEYGPIFGENTCVTRTCGGAMFGPQTCARPDIPCDKCTPKPQPTRRQAYIQQYKTAPAAIYDRIHKCSDLAPFQLEWVDFRINDGHSESYSRKLGKYRFRLFGCRRFSKDAILNEGRIIQKDMEFIDIFEDIVKDCYNIVKVPNDVCLRDQDYEAPEYILTAEITDYFMNVCDGYDWDEAQATDKRTGSAEMTVTWRLLDLTKTKVMWKGETTGYSELDSGSYNGEIDLIERAFADATLNLKGLPEFEEQLAQRVPADVLEQQKATLLAIEQATDPVKCKVEVPQASICPIAEETLAPQQCPMPAEIIEYEPTNVIYTEPETDPIPLEFDQAPYANNGGNICYGYNDNLYMDATQPAAIYSIPANNICESELTNYMSPEENACENPLFGQDGQDCDPSLVSFIKADQDCPERNFEHLIEEQAPQICLFSNQIESAGGISIDTGYNVPEVEEVTPTQAVGTAPDWQPYMEETVSREPEIIQEQKVVPEPEIIEQGNYKEADHFCIENIAPYPDMRPENLYRVRASMMSIRNGLNKQSAGLLIADDLILTSADAVDEGTVFYNVETINGVKATAKVVRINVKKNIALLQTTQKMYFRPLSLNMGLPPVGSDGYMSLGLLNNAEGENYLDDKGKVKGYRFSETMGTEIITDTFVQTVSSGGALIDEKGVVTGLASRNQKFDDKGDLFLPIQDAINSVGLEVCGQAEPFQQKPMAVVKPVSTAIDSYTGSKEPAIMAKSKRK